MLFIIGMIGETKVAVLVLVAFGVNASFGALDGFVVDVTHAVPLPVTLVVQLAGNAGAETASKF